MPTAATTTSDNPIATFEEEGALSPKAEVSPPTPPYGALASTHRTVFSTARVLSSTSGMLTNTQIIALFRETDISGDGSLDAEELIPLMKRLHRPFDEESVEKTLLEMWEAGGQELVLVGGDGLAHRPRPSIVVRRLHFARGFGCTGAPGSRTAPRGAPTPWQQATPFSNQAPFNRQSVRAIQVQLLVDLRS